MGTTIVIAPCVDELLVSPLARRKGNDTIRKNIAEKGHTRASDPSVAHHEEPCQQGIALDTLPLLPENEG